MNATSKTALKPTPQEIALRAYQLWESEGCKPGQDTKYWLQAEKELCDARQAAPAATATTTTTPPPAAPNAAPQPKANSRRSRVPAC